MKAIVLAIAAAGCGSFGATPGDDDVDAPPSDAFGCRVSITTTPDNPAVGMPVRATANDDTVTGVPTRSWTVTFNGAPVAFDEALPQQKAIEFTPAIAGVYHVTLDVQPANGCDQAQPVDVSVHMPGANVVDYRLRISPLALSHVPAQDQHIQVFGGANNSLSEVALQKGLALAGQVVDSAQTPFPAFVQFYSPGTRLPLTQLFTDATGNWSAQLLDAYDVVVIPLDGTKPAERLVAWSSSSSIKLDAPQTISGVVHDPSGAALPNARVEIVIDGVPASLATTASDGSFTALGFYTAGKPVDITVTPAAGSPLPSLRGSSTTWNLGAQLAINYAATFATAANVGGIHVRRGGAAAPNAKVVIAGTIPTGGTIAGVAVNAIARVAVTTNASGDIPAGTTAPKGALSLVLDAIVNQVDLLGIGALDLTGTPPTAVDTAAPVNASGAIHDANNAPLGNVTVDAIPIGALASAGGAVVHTTTASDGSYTLSLVSGGHYALRIRDPSAHGGPLDLTDVTSATLPATTKLFESLTVSGFATSQNQPVGNASVQVLCATCTGIGATRPLGEGATDASGNFVLAVQDPGTM